VRCISAVFWKTGRNLRVFSTGTEKSDFAGISGFVRHKVSENGAQFGLIFLYVSASRIPGFFDGGL
jgi:hypothetical protein